MSAVVAPPGSSGAVAEGLAAAAVAVEDKLAFLAEADLAQRRLADALAEQYGRRVWARLLAMRVTNLAVALHHFHHRHTTIASRPIQIMLDPVNNCHLSCPGCLHTSNPKHAGTFDWPGGLLPMPVYERLLAEQGPTGWGLVLYNWGEPLLNKRTPEMIRLAKRHLLHVCLSTNFSVRFDVPALVVCGA